MDHKHAPQTLPNGMRLYVCACGARKQKSKIIDGKKVEVWKMESADEKAARERTIENLETEGYGYGQDPHDPHDGGRGTGAAGEQTD